MWTRRNSFSEGCGQEPRGRSAQAAAPGAQGPGRGHEVLGFTARAG